MWTQLTAEQKTRSVVSQWWPLTQQAHKSFQSAAGPHGLKAAVNGLRQRTGNEEVSLGIGREAKKYPYEQAGNKRTDPQHVFFLFFFRFDF